MSEQRGGCDCERADRWACTAAHLGLDPDHAQPADWRARVAESAYGPCECDCHRCGAVECYQPTEDDALAYIRRAAATSPGLSFPVAAYKQVARLMLAFRNADWSARPCLACGAVSVGLYRGRVEFPTCGSPKCELKMQGGIDAADGSNR